jgi:hypothetical protein
LISLFCVACGSGTPPADLPIGDQLPDDLKADGTWGAALTCKPAPSLPSLVAPQITVSLDGLTLHLVDPASGYDKVFPIGPGAIEGNPSAAAFGESHTWEPVIQTGKQDFAIHAGDIQTCKTWWTDPDTGAKSPVFAGLPFMPFYGGYAVHGPIDNFRATNGGNLRRGFVSHGCVRMEAADVLEIWARIHSVASTPVHLQRDPERLSDGTRVDVAKWVGAECDSDGDCDFAGGFCHANPYGRGFCSMPCTATCADRAGQVPTFCVADPDDATRGICVAKMIAQDQDCRQLGQMSASTQNRFHQSLRASVCLPGSRGWIGDPCLADGDCKNGTSCQGGVCTESCTRFCPDEPARPSTFCAQSGDCARACTPSSNASECGGGSCVQVAHAGDGAMRFACPN